MLYYDNIKKILINHFLSTPLPADDVFSQLIDTFIYEELFEFILLDTIDSDICQLIQKYIYSPFGINENNFQQHTENCSELFSFLKTINNNSLVTTQFLFLIYLRINHSNSQKSIDEMLTSPMRQLSQTIFESLFLNNIELILEINTPFSLSLGLQVLLLGQATYIQNPIKQQQILELIFFQIAKEKEGLMATGNAKKYFSNLLIQIESSIITKTGFFRNNTILNAAPQSVQTICKLYTNFMVSFFEKMEDEFIALEINPGIEILKFLIEARKNRGYEGNNLGLLDAISKAFCVIQNSITSHVTRNLFTEKLFTLLNFETFNGELTLAESDQRAVIISNWILSLTKIEDGINYSSTLVENEFVINCLKSNISLKKHLVACIFKNLKVSKNTIQFLSNIEDTKYSVKYQCNQLVDVFSNIAKMCNKNSAAAEENTAVVFELVHAKANAIIPFLCNAVQQLSASKKKQIHIPKFLDALFQIYGKATNFDVEHLIQIAHLTKKFASKDQLNCCWNLLLNYYASLNSKDQCKYEIIIESLIESIEHVTDLDGLIESWKTHAIGYQNNMHTSSQFLCSRIHVGKDVFTRSEEEFENEILKKISNESNSKLFYCYYFLAIKPQNISLHKTALNILSLHFAAHSDVIDNSWLLLFINQLKTIRKLNKEAAVENVVNEFILIFRRSFVLSIDLFTELSKWKSLKIVISTLDYMGTYLATMATHQDPHNNVILLENIPAFTACIRNVLPLRKVNQDIEKQIIELMIDALSIRSINFTLLRSSLKGALILKIFNRLLEKAIQNPSYLNDLVYHLDIIFDHPKEMVAFAYNYYRFFAHLFMVSLQPKASFMQFIDYEEYLYTTIKQRISGINEEQSKIRFSLDEFNDKIFSRLNDNALPPLLQKRLRNVFAVFKFASIDVMRNVNAKGKNIQEKLAWYIWQNIPRLIQIFPENANYQNLLNNLPFSAALFFTQPSICENSQKIYIHIVKKILEEKQLIIDENCKYLMNIISRAFQDPFAPIYLHFENTLCNKDKWHVITNVIYSFIEMDNSKAVLFAWEIFVDQISLDLKDRQCILEIHDKLITVISCSLLKNKNNKILIIEYVERFVLHMLTKKNTIKENDQFFFHLMKSTLNAFEKAFQNTVNVLDKDEIIDLHNVMLDLIKTCLQDPYFILLQNTIYQYLLNIFTNAYLNDKKKLERLIDILKLFPKTEMKNIEFKKNRRNHLEKILKVIEPVHKDLAAATIKKFNTQNLI